MITFVLCPAFHGATLLSLLLNNHSQIFSLGDTNPTREYDQSCSCGEKVSSCDFWEHIRNETDWKAEEELPLMMPSYPRLCRAQDINKVLNAALSIGAVSINEKLWRLGGQKSKAFYKSYEQFLEACQSWSPHEVFVDGEKNLLKFMALASRGFPVGRIIHLVRDPRGYVYSFLKYNPESSAKEVARDWRAQHRKITFFTNIFKDIPVRLLRYEDLAVQPQDTMKGLFDFLGLKPEDVVCSPKDSRKHHLMGNKMLRVFDGKVRHDESWRKTLCEEQFEVVFREAAPLFEDFGYER